MSEQEQAGLVEYSVADKIATIRLNRPEKMNAASDELIAALIAAFRRFDADKEAWTAVLCGNGRAFCTGADVLQRQLRSREEFERLGGPQAFGANCGDLFIHAVNWKPIITAVHGYVLGLALGIMLESDLVVAEEGTIMQLTETSRGLGGGKYWSLLEMRGAGSFGNEIAITGRRFTAEEAKAAGVIDRLAPKGKYLDVAYEMARQINTNPPLSVRSTVRARRWKMEQIGKEMEVLAEPAKLYLTEDFHEAALSFKEKRNPRPFQGR